MILAGHGARGPGGVPRPHPCCCLVSQKAAWASPCLSHLHTLLSIRVHAFSLCVARQHTALVPLSDLLPAHTLAPLLRADRKLKTKMQCLRYFLGGGGIAAFLATLLPESGPRCQASEGKKVYWKSRSLSG